VHTDLSSGLNGKRRLRVGGHALVSGCPEHWIHFNRAKVHRRITIHVRPKQMDGQTDRQTGRRTENIMAIVRRFVLRTHRVLKI